MKNLSLIILTVGLIVMATACNKGGRHVTIVKSDGNNYLKIEYQGRVLFNTEKLTIESITPNGYVKYAKDDQKLIAQNDGSGSITYQLNNGEPLRSLDASGKAFLAKAVKEMIKYGHNYNNK